MSRTISDGGVHSLQEILSRLKFLGKIKPGDRVNVEKLYLVPDTYYNRAMRMFRSVWLGNESRDSTLEFIQNTLAEALRMLEDNSRQTPDERRMLTEDITNVRGGLEALKSTYASDDMYTARIDTLINLIPICPNDSYARKK